MQNRLVSRVLLRSDNKLLGQSYLQSITNLKYGQVNVPRAESQPYGSASIREKITKSVESAKVPWTRSHNEFCYNIN